MIKAIWKAANLYSSNITMLNILIIWGSQLAPPNTIYRGCRYTGRIVVYPIDADLDHSLFDL